MASAILRQTKCPFQFFVNIHATLYLNKQRQHWGEAYLHDLCPFCRKTPNDVVEAHPSNIETAAHMENIQNLCGSSNPTSVETIRESVHHVEAVMERAHHGGGWLLSGILCINILILGCALVSGSALNSVAITTVHKQIFLIILLLLTMLWMLFYAAVTSRKEQGVLFKDSHAGPMWLRGENSKSFWICFG